MRSLSPEDQIRLREGNIQMYILLLLLVASFWAVTIAYQLYLESENSQNLTEIKNPEAATSGRVHNN